MTIPVDVEVIGLYPHAHYLGKIIDVRVQLPDGTERQLIRIDNWDFNWQDTYPLVRPAVLPTGSRILLEYTYDNSAANPHNPNNPPARVVYGPDSADEMAELWLQVLPVVQSDLASLERTMATKSVADRVAGWQHLVRLDSMDASAQSNLAAYYASAGDVSRAIAHYRKAVAAEPDFAGAHYNLGNLLESSRDVEGAMRHYRLALQARPDHAGSHNNLGRLLAASGRRDEAIVHFGRVVELDPDSAGGHYNLAIALISAGRSEAGLEHYSVGERLGPEAVQERLAVAWLLATHPSDRARRPADAIRIAEAVGNVLGRPHPLALDVLAAAQAAGGAFGYAATLAAQAVRLATDAGQTALAGSIQSRLDLYRTNRAYTEAIR
jgi:tetratricopeptide (TPR) repeat protein